MFKNLKEKMIEKLETQATCACSDPTEKQVTHIETKHQSASCCDSGAKPFPKDKKKTKSCC